MIRLVQEVKKYAQADWRDICGPYCNDKTNERGLVSNFQSLQPLKKSCTK